jgi:hypothetical protein
MVKTWKYDPKFFLGIETRSRAALKLSCDRVAYDELYPRCCKIL